MLWNQNSSCEVLLIQRRNVFDVASFLQEKDLSSIARYMVDQGTAVFCGDNGYNDVIAGNWSKDTSGNAGVFSFQLKKRRYAYDTLISAGDLLLIFMDSEKDYTKHQLFSGTFITVGIVDNVTEIRQATGEGATTLLYNVNGRDFTAIFTDTSTIFDPAFAQLAQDLFTQPYQLSLLAKQASAQSPVENIHTLINLFYNQKASGSQLVGSQWQYRIRGDEPPVPLVSLLDLTTFVQVPMFGYAPIGAISPAQAGNVWTLLETYANSTLNEMFIDVRDYTPEERAFLAHQAEIASAFVTAEDVAKQKATAELLRTSGVFRDVAGREAATGVQSVPALVFRQMPYDTDAFMKLPQVSVYPTEIFEATISRAMHDVVNVFRVTSPSVPLEYQEATFGLTVNLESIARFGIRRMESQTIYFFASSTLSNAYDTGSAAVQDFNDIFEYYVGLLSTWHACNHELRAGQLVMRYRPDIRAGVRLRLYHGAAFTIDDPSSFTDYYVQGVSHNYAVDAGASRTTLSLVRGVRTGEGGLPANLRWTTSGQQIPAELNPLFRWSVLGFQKNGIASDGKAISGVDTSFAPATATPGVTTP